MPDPEVPPPNPPAPAEPAPAPQTPAAPSPAASTVGTTGLMPNVAAGLACLFPLVGGIVFLVLEKKDAFVRFYAMQSVFFGGALLIVNIALWIIGLIFGAIPVLNIIIGVLLFISSLLLGLAALVVYVILLVKAFTGAQWDMPWLGQMARAQLARMPA